MKFKIESTAEEQYCLNYKTYYKRHWYSPWRRFGNKSGYLTTEQCLSAIEIFKIDYKKLKELNK